MNPHYHPYGGGGGGGGGGAPPTPDLAAASPTGGGHAPPSPSDAYQAAVGHQQHQQHNRMMAANGHGIGSMGMPNGPHDPHNPHGPHHPAYPSGGQSEPPHHQQHQQQQHHGGGGPPAPNNNNNSVKVCAGCGGKIMERFFLHALDRYWHNGCLKCSCCAAMLADIGTSCFTKGGMILCKQDYMRSRRLFGSSGACSACGQTIPASEFVMRSGGPTMGGPGGGGGGGAPPTGAPHHQHVFHLKCFMCSKCLSPLVPGDRYYMLAGSLVCEQDWHKLLKSSAAAPTVRKGKVGRPRRTRD